MKLDWRRNATGTWRAYLRPADGGESVPYPHNPVATRDDPAVLAWRETYEATMARLGATGKTNETTDDYFARWLADRVRRGIATTRNDKGRYTKHVSPIIGRKPIASLTRRDLEEVVEALDRSVQESTKREAAGVKGPFFRPKTARNVWGTVTKMMRDACTSKVLALRVRDDNPASVVLPPEKGIDREGPYLFPAEFLALMNCERVPVRWKRMITLAVYLMVRRGELHALEWSAVNLDQGYVSIHQAIDSDTRATKSTKTGRNRKVPIEPTLVPLLRAMHKEAGGRGRVVPSMPPDEELASRLRKYLAWAGVTRAELFASDATRRPITWHDLRHTGACWRIIRGDNPKKVQRAGGWRTAAMLDRYVNEAETFESTETFGYPFPAVTVSVTGSPFSEDSPSNPATLAASPGGFEPPLAA